MPQRPSLSNLYDKALQARTHRQALLWMTVIRDVMWMTASGAQFSQDEAKALIRHNLGYQAGYHDEETRRRVEELYATEHPILGSIAELGPPTADEAFTLGVNNGNARPSAPRTLKELRNERNGQAATGGTTNGEAGHV